MIKIENVNVFGWEAAMRGMRNPMNSWDKSDSEFNVDWIDDSVYPHISGHDSVIIGPNDLARMKELVRAGTDHSKFMRMINVTMDIVAPLYWWKEFDTCKVGTVRNSCSTMHKIHDKEFTLDDFSHEHLIEDEEHMAVFVSSMHRTIADLNTARDFYLETKNKDWWWQMIQLLPSSYNQRATVQLNYEVLLKMYHSRKNHKLDEWVEFCKWIETLPYMNEFIGGNENDN